MPRRTKSPSLAQDLVMMGDVYLTLAWLAVQRLRYGPLWPWEAQSNQRTPRLVALARPEEMDEESEETEASKRS